MRLVLLLAVWLFNFVFIQPAAAASWVTNGPMDSPRIWHTATLLSNGKILLAGGFTNFGTGYLATRTAEVFDPATGSSKAVPSLTRSRGLHTATILPNGKVLIVGGTDNPAPAVLSVHCQYILWCRG